MPDQWTKSQKIAFAFVQSGVSRQLNATDALKQYRAGGGAIRDSSWYSLYKQEFAATGTRENIKQIPVTYTIPDAMFERVDWDLREPYTMVMKVHGWSEELQRHITKWVTVESNILLTKAEWRWGAQQAVSDTIGSPPFIISRFSEYIAYKRMR